MTCEATSRLYASQEELRRQEEVWSRELADLGANQEALLVVLEKTDFEIKASQVVISRAREHVIVSGSRGLAEAPSCTC